MLKLAFNLSITLMMATDFLFIRKSVESYEHWKGTILTSEFYLEGSNFKHPKLWTTC